MISYTRLLLSSALVGVLVALLILWWPKPDDDIDFQTESTRISYAGQASYAEAVDKARPAVVNIYTTTARRRSRNPLYDDPFFREFFGDMFEDTSSKPRSSLGSGVIVNSAGYILTNNHVVKGADSIRVILHDGTRLDAQIIGTDPMTDLAVLKVNARNLTPITLGTSSNLRVGDVVLAIGNPFGVGQTVTMGIISATGRNQLGITEFENFIQTDAAINPGNSGGALIDAHGRLIGINTAIFSKSGGYQGIGFAIPVDMITGIMKQLVENGKVSRGWIGIGGQDVTPALAASFGLSYENGVLISQVYSKGPADKAGLKPGDIIVQMDDKQIKSSTDILDFISTHNSGTKITIQGWRGKQRFETTLVLESRSKILKSNR